MSSPRRFIVGLISLVVSLPLLAADWSVGNRSELQAALERAADGDRILLAEGRYRGSFRISTSVTLTTMDSAIIDAGGEGNALVIEADNVSIENLKIRQWGSDLTHTHSAIKAIAVSNLSIKNTHLSGDGFGIYLEGVNRGLIEGNEVIGNVDMRSPDRGNGIHLVNSQQVVVKDNVISHTRDGLYIINSQHNELLNNQMQALRFAVHYMYSHSNTVRGNVATNVDVGYALMSSRDLTILNNTAENCRDYGLLLNFINTSVFEDNHISQIRSGDNNRVANDEGKALFVYNSGYNHFRRNRFADSDLGIHLTAGSEGNEFTENEFIHNRVQVKYVSSREQEWSVAGRGNFWSNYLGWDMNADGIGDAGFEPNDDMDKLLWKYPEADVLMDSPAVLLLRWVQRSFPILKSPGVKDSYPLYEMTGAHR